MDYKIGKNNLNIKEHQVIMLFESGFPCVNRLHDTETIAHYFFAAKFFWSQKNLAASLLPF
ncbi:MAG: hypothetical protein DRR19_05865 [Candidatus Parabeggiatoa sp. nov. 1]|nr:MAG: hypothetical protein DRR19_05865 [Gammaproteobacteria bacterium]